MKFVARQGETDLPVEVVRHGSAYRVRLGDRWMEADLVKVGPYVRSLRLEDGRQFALVHHREGATHEISMGGASVYVDIIDPLTSRRQRREDEVEGGGTVRAPMPGRVVRIMVTAGDVVVRGTGIAILEAMKMENEIRAPKDGTVAEILVEAGTTVEAGAELLRIE